MPSSPFGPVGLDAPAVDAPLAPQSVPAEPEHERPCKRAIRARAEARALLEQESHQRRAGARKRHEPDAAPQRRELPSSQIPRPASVAHKLTERHEAGAAVEAGVRAAV